MESWPATKTRNVNLAIIRDNLHDIHSLCPDLCAAFCCELEKNNVFSYTIKEDRWQNLQLICLDIKSKYMEILSRSEVLSLKDRQDLYFQTGNMGYRRISSIADNIHTLNELLDKDKVKKLEMDIDSFMEFINLFGQKLEF